MKKITAITWILVFVYLSSIAQDVTFSGSGACGAGPVAGSWIVPCDVTSITIAVYGGGGGAGGGGGGSNGGFFDTRGGGGGGGGGYTTITINVLPGSSFNYSAGAGGCGGDGNDDGQDGDNGASGAGSTFTGTDASGTPVNLTANGGVRGTGGDGTEGSPGSGGAGGSASGGTTNTSGASGNNGSGGNGGSGGAGAGPGGGAGGAPDSGNGSAYGGGGGGGEDSDGGNGAAGAILITYVTTVTIPVPVISTSPPTCTLDGSSTITNYDPAMTYQFAPPGPAAGAGGAITGMITGTSYTVVASIAGCNSQPSASFSNAPASPLPVPLISTTPPTCTADGSSTITNYNGALSYLFTPAGPSANAGGIISGMTTATSYTVEASDGTCTSAPSAPFSNAAQLPAPTAVINGLLSYCTGGNTTLTASGGTGFAWTDAGGANISNIADVTVTQGDYTVVVSDANNCMDTATATVTEIAGPAVTLTAAPMQICAGQSATFTAAPSGYPLYEFYLNGALAQSGAGNTYSNTTLVQGDIVNVRAQDNGCFGAFSNDVSVTILQIGTATVTLAAQPDTICTGQSVTFTATPATYDSYEFLLNGVAVQSGFSETYSTTILVQGDVVTARASDLGCFGPESNPVSVTVLQQGTAMVTLSASDDTICLGQSVTFTANPSGFTAYEFLRNGSIVQSGASDTYITTTLIAVDSVTVRALDQGCFGPESNIINVVIEGITADAGSDIDFCKGDDAVTLQGFNPPGGTWSGNGISDAAGVFDPAAAGIGQHTLSYSYTDVSGCSDTDDIIANVHAPAKPDFSAAPVIADVTNNTPIVFTDLTNGATNWLWDFGDEGSSTDQHPSHIYTDPGTYTVTLITTDANGCIDTIQKPQYITIHEGVGAFVPNAFSPDNNSVNDLLQVYGKGIDRVVLRIFNRWGELVFETRDVNGAWDGTYNGKALPPDVYVYTLYAEFLDFTSERQKGSITLMR